jgi:sugar phosphate isomerase/epimerase
MVWSSPVFRCCVPQEFLPMMIRRTFLRAAAMATGVATLSATGSPVAAIEPLKREQPKFKFSLAAYSYRNLLQGSPPMLTLFDFIDDCARWQLDGTELTSYYFPPDVTPAYLNQLKHHCFIRGLTISGTAVGNDFGHPPGPQRDEQLAAVKRWIDRAAMMGAPVIRIFAGHVKEGYSAEQTHLWMVDGINECCRYAGEHGVHLALENHGGPTATAEGLLRFVHAVDSPWFGVNLDTGNFHSQDVYAELEQVAPYALNVQVKVVVSGPDGTKQPTDYARLAKILRDANYRGFVVLEYEESDNPRIACGEHLETLRRAFA